MLFCDSYRAIHYNKSTDRKTHFWSTSSAFLSFFSSVGRERVCYISRRLLRIEGSSEFRTRCSWPDHRKALCAETRRLMVSELFRSHQEQGTDWFKATANSSSHERTNDVVSEQNGFPNARTERLKVWVPLMAQQQNHSYKLPRKSLSVWNHTFHPSTQRFKHRMVSTLPPSSSKEKSWG